MKRVFLSLTLLALAIPAPAFARGTFDPTTEFEQHEWVSIHLGPLNLSITKAVVYLLIGTALTILLGLVLMRGKTLNRRQTVGEGIYEIAQVQVAEQGLPGKAIGRWFPYVASLMLFIWVVNLIGFIPLPLTGETWHGVPVWGIYAATSSLSVTLALAPADLRVHAFRGHPLERARPLLQELDPGGAEAAARADRAARDPRAVHAPDLAERPALRQHARRATS